MKTITRLAWLRTYHNGFRAYSKNVIWELNLFENGMPVSYEIPHKAKQKGLTVKEAPTVYYDIEKVSS